LNLRIGLSSGPVVAGIIGSKKFTYDLWGDTVNIASRMESQGELGFIQVSQSTFDLLRETHVLRERGRIEVKGKGEMTTYFLVARKS
jgi:class 3 adenylate cyclase